ncbi:PREDICTED: DNA-binding protein D-ETS-4 isoform X2 [Nicrophorus vespilloides]|uniref:DNA-binding protein D-ETS-4 isoform X2 n=1 Tax=Nicrophorus vespilloides TaxID=110193 RepID=A0ABM1MZI6_NICVS|nr:PREDICTED: DNA-binding protein D-ETS-4 isoform X2 [Nicrophorus vespilloides]XP_017779987.1 PREDICTED: DNA-binding protein D-ETS-4 isoform X2 [Nicrophorus vespilloides]
MMPQIVPSAGFTPPCDYSNFADAFDLSLLPDLQTAAQATKLNYYPQEKAELDLGPDFQKLLAPSETPHSPESIYLEVPTHKNYHPNSPIGALTPYSPQLLSPNFYPNSPELSLYTSSSDEYVPNYIKKEYNENIYGYLDSTQIKQESTVDFTGLYEEKPKDHQLLREVLRDTSFQKKFNIKPFDFAFDVKMEEPEEKDFCTEQLKPVLNLAIEQMRKDVEATCTTLGISTDPSQWSQSNVLSWLEWTSRQFSIPAPIPERWDLAGAPFVNLSEEDFVERSPLGGAILYAQLEIWKAAFSDEEFGSMHWLPETTSNASSGDVSDDEDEEMQPPPSEPTKATTSARPSGGGSHIHLWQFLKELLSTPGAHGTCIRWLDRSKGVFKIEDSVKVARLWGKRKNRPAMNYDKLSRSIRQYYKKGIMKKTERSQRLVYQFCHPYCL